MAEHGHLPTLLVPSDETATTTYLGIPITVYQDGYIIEHGREAHWFGSMARARKWIQRHRR